MQIANWNVNKKVLMLIVFVVTAVTIAYSVYLVSKIATSTPDSGGNSTSQNYYFVAPPENSGEIEIGGKIVPIPTNIVESQYAHELVDENGQRLAYIYSDKNNLDLPSGMKVEIIGVTEAKKYNGYDVIKVTKLKLK